RVVQHGAVLGHDEVEEVELRADREQVVEAATGNQQHAAARLAHPLQRLERGWCNRAGGRQGPVVVAHQNVKPHGSAHDTIAPIGWKSRREYCLSSQQKVLPTVAALRAGICRRCTCIASSLNEYSWHETRPSLGINAPARDKESDASKNTVGVDW